MNRDRFWLTDTQFSKIEPHLPTDTRGKARVDDRRVISGIIHVLKSRRSLGRCAARVRTKENTLQPLRPLGGERRVG
jgi:transposase